MQKLRIHTIAIQGRKASFSHLAACNLYEVDRFLYHDSFEQVFDDLRTAKADLIVVPIENSTYGSVYENYDQLTEHTCQIVAETYIEVSLYLIGLPESHLAEIKKVYSHQVALDQIRRFRTQNNHLEFIPCPDTAGAAEMVRRINDPSLAACASKSAAESNNLLILTPSIEDNHHNFTRFFAISRNNLQMPNAEVNKTTVQFELGSEAGSLYKTLRSFADRDLALSRIESRPIINTDWNYRFYVDIVASTKEAALQHALSEMKDYVKNNQIQILGSYPSISPPA